MSRLKLVEHPMKKKFEKNLTFLPVTMQQFEELTNEILAAVNEVCDPHFLNADYMAQILMSAIHALDHKQGLIEKSALFEGCINRISCHVTYHASEEIRKRLSPEAKPQEGTTDVGNGNAIPDEDEAPLRA